MKARFWERTCTFRRLYLIFVAICGGLLVMMILTLPAQPAGSSSEAITIINIFVLTFGAGLGVFVYYWCSLKARKSLDPVEE